MKQAGQLLVVAALCAACASGGRGRLGDASSDGFGSDTLGNDAADANGDVSTSDRGLTDVAQDRGLTDSAVGDAAMDGPTDVGTDSGTDVPPAIDAGPTCDPTPTTLGIVEVMISSRSGSGDRGEWFEVVNTGSCTIDLSTLTIASPTGAGVAKTHMVRTGLVAPGASFVFAQSGNPDQNHGLSHDYVYAAGTSADVILNNSADWLELRLGGLVIDRVTWPSSGFTHGRSRQLSSTFSIAFNDDWSRWCDSTATYSTTPGGPFLGTPGAANGLCP